jgi:hypothetical protein
MSNKIMAWSECSIKIGATGTNDAMAAVLTSIGTIKEKSSSLEASDGDVMKSTASGGATVAQEQLEGGFVLKTRVIEPENEFYTTLSLGVSSGSDLIVKTHIVSGNYSVKLEPKNVGAKGIEAPKASIKFTPGYSEEEGNYLDLEFTILKTEGVDPYWYKRVTKVAANLLVIAPTSLNFTTAADNVGQAVTVTSTGNVTTASVPSEIEWCTVTKSLKVVTVKVAANNNSEPRSCNVTIVAEGKTAIIPVVQAGV